MPYFRVRFGLSGNAVGIWKGENERDVLDSLAQKLVGVSEYSKMIESDRKNIFICEEWSPSADDMLSLYQLCINDGAEDEYRTCVCALTGCVECYERCADVISSSINEGWDEYDSGAINN